MRRYIVVISGRTTWVIKPLNFKIWSVVSFYSPVVKSLLLWERAEEIRIRTLRGNVY
jgi:hypothetical protein